MQLQVIEDDQKRVLRAARYEYDKNEERIEEHIYIASSYEKGIEFDSKGTPAGLSRSRRCITFTSVFPFSVQSATDSNGDSVTYSYLQGTGLVTEKISRLCDGTEVKSQFSYQKDNGFLTQKIETKKRPHAVIEKHACEIQPRDLLGKNEEVISETWGDEKKVLHKVQQRHTFDRYGNLLKKEFFDDKEMLLKVESYAYDAHGNCVQYTNPIGQTTKYTYDANDNCIEVQELFSGRTFKLMFDVGNRPVVLLESFKDGHIVRTGTSYDSRGNKIATVDRYGNETKYTYDGFSHLTSITYPEILNEHKEVVQPVEQFEYDFFGNLISTTDPRGYKTLSKYNPDSSLIHRKYPDNSEERFSYRQKGSLEMKIERNGIFKKFNYRKNGELHSIKKFTDSSLKEKIGEQDLNYRSGMHGDEETLDGRRFYRTYDVIGRLVAEAERGEKQASSFARREYYYDSQNRLSRLQQGGGSNTLIHCFAYDALDRIIERWIEDPNGIKRHQHVYVYDAFGHRSEEKNGSCTYIEGNRPQQIVDKFGGIMRFEYLDGPHLQEKKVINALGVTTKVTYDALDREVYIEKRDPFGELLSQKELNYDVANNLAAVEETIFPGQKKVRTEYRYGPLNRLESLREAVGTPELRETVYCYTENGALLSKSTAGQKISYNYGADGLIEKIYNKNNELLSTMKYDAAGRLVEGKTNQNIAVKRFYGAMGLISKEEITDVYGSYSISFEYDQVGRILSIKLPDGSAIIYSYTGSLLTTVRRRTKWDEHFYSRSLKAHDLNGRSQSEQTSDDASISKVYDKDGALSSLESPHYSSKMLERDLLGNPTKLRRNGQEFSYKYNYLNQLTKQEGEKSHSYQFDSVDNLLQKDDVTYTYNALNERSDLVYNEQGAPFEIGDLQLAYNEHEQLLSARNKNTGKTAEYGYDIYGRRVVTREDKIIRRSFFVGAIEIGAIDTCNNMLQLKVPAQVLRNQAVGAVSIEINQVEHVPVYDHFSNILGITFGYGKKMGESYSFSPFGEEENTAYINPWRYQGMRVDNVTGFVSFPFRDYVPALQRFLTKDPLGFADGPNLYAYVHGNPLSYRDPDGLKTRYGPCECHGIQCGYYTSGTCGHGGGVLLEDPNEDCEVALDLLFEQKLYANSVSEIPYPQDVDKRDFFSHIESLNRPEFNHVQVGFMNGIWNQFDGVHASALALSDMLGGKNVTIIYNAGHGVATDLQEAGMNFYGTATNPSIELLRLWTEFHATRSAEDVFIMVCHSQGVIHVRNALAMCSRSIQQRVVVIAVCPGKYIARDLCRVPIHVVNDSKWRDFVPRIDQAGLKIARKEETVEFVHSHPDAPSFDHEFLSLTYQNHVKALLEDQLDAFERRAP